MKKKILSLLSVTLCVILLAFSCFATSITYDPEKEIFIVDGEEFYPELLGDEYHVLPRDAVKFEIRSSSIHLVYDLYIGNAEHPEIVTFDKAYVDIIYVNADAKIEIENFKKGGTPKYYYISNNDGMYGCEISDDLITQLCSLNGETIEITSESRDTAFTSELQIIGYDAYKFVFKYIASVFFDKDGNAYFVNYNDVDMGCFYSDGKLSSKKAVMAYKVDSENSKKLSNSLMNWNYYADNYVYTSDNDSSKEVLVKVIFWISFALLFFIAPIILLIVGTVLCLKKNRVNSKKWLPLVITSSLWIISSVVIMLILLL